MEGSLWLTVCIGNMAIADTIRFAYYLDKNNTILQFLRYNACLILHPLGVILELGVVHSARAAVNLILIEKLKLSDMIFRPVSIMFYPMGISISGQIFPQLISQRQKFYSN